MFELGRIGGRWAVLLGGLLFLAACGQTHQTTSPGADAGADPGAGGSGAEPAAGGAGGDDAPSVGGAPGESGGQSSAGAGATQSSCDGDLSECSGRCVDERFDPQHCGACDKVCRVGELCSAGQCAASCLGGSTECGTRCVDLDWDPANCGGCAQKCAAGEVCSRGECGVECVGGSSRCADACVDLRFDPQNCGACGKACADGAVCFNGACEKRCGAGLIECDGQCVNAALDLANCGTCGHVCDQGKVCSSGQCSNTCAGSIRCGNACVDVLTDAANCGGCGSACGAGETCVNGDCGRHCELSSRTECYDQCVDTKTDANNCGYCGGACYNGRSCVDSACVCGDGKVECQGACVDTKTDAKNCSVCGNACGSNETCVDSSCECQEGTLRCGDDCIDTSISAANCGACGKVCAAGKVCTAGKCEAATGSWQTFQSNVRHSGENPDETGAPPLKFGWRKNLGGAVHPVAGENGRIFVTLQLYFQDTDGLFALNVSDGSLLWKKNFGSLCCIGHPAVFDGSVYVANGKNGNEPNLLWSLTSDKGGLTWYSNLSAQWEQYFAPIVANGAVYTNAGYYGGLYGVALDDGTNLFTNLELEQYDEWSPAFFGNNVWTFVSGTLRKHDPKSGKVLAHTTVTWNWSGWSMDNAPVFGDSLAYVIAPPSVYAINPGTSEVAWSADGAYSGTPAFANGLVFAISAGNLIVRNGVTGKLAWSFVADSQLRYPPVIANGYVYLASDQNVYAVSLDTHEAAFHERGGGWLSIVNHRLLVAGSDGSLTAYILSLP